MMENALADLIPTRSIKRNLPLNLMAGKLVGRNEKCAKRRIFKGYLAEKVGFEPTVMLPPRLISSQVHSTTLPLLLHSHLRLVTAANSNSALSAQT